MTATNNASFFDRNVPNEIQKSVLRLILEEYASSSRYCFRHFSAPQAKDLSGVFRRAKIEENLSGVAERFKEHVSAAVEYYDGKTGSYNELTCGQVKITQSCVIDRDELPRQAKFRMTLAENGQLSLFANHDETAPKPNFLYAILTHGVDVNSPKRSWPAFVKIQFPNSDCTQYVDEGINLLTRFPEVAAEYLPNFATKRQPSRRKQKKLGEA
jgi:hypothetical protein